MTLNGGPHKTFEGKQVRAVYRTAMTGEDRFNLSYLSLASDGVRSFMTVRELARFALETFVLSVELKQADGTWGAPIAFTWDVIRGLTDVQMDGWPQELALEIIQGVIKRQLADTDALKKTSLTPSDPGSSGATPGAAPVTPSPTSTS